MPRSQWGMRLLCNSHRKALVLETSIDEERLGEQMIMLGKDYEPFKREVKKQEPKPKDPLAGSNQHSHVNPEKPFTGNK